MHIIYTWNRDTWNREGVCEGEVALVSTFGIVVRHHSGHDFNPRVAKCDMRIRKIT